jgi:tetratricopeptide (TPR) repeat protein
MNAIKLNLLAVALLTQASSAQAAQHYVGDFVFPKSYPGRLMVGQRVAGEVTATDFLTVLEVQGEWLWVESASVYNTDEVGAKGWVRASEVDNIDEQIRWAETLIGKNPGDPDFYEYAGLVCRLSERPDMLKAGISYFTRAISLSPADETLYQMRSYCWSQLDQYEPAIADLEAALRLDPSNQVYRDVLDYFRQELESQQGAAAPYVPASPTGSPGLDKSVAAAGMAPAA